MILHRRIKLRAIEESDAVHYHKWINDAETNYWRGLYPPISLKDAEGTLKSMCDKSSEQMSLTILGDDELPIGLIGLRGICSRSRRAELWIYIGNKNYWNKGFGKESLFALTNYAFEEMNLHRIWLECDPNFVASVKCYEKIGFSVEGRLKDGYFRHGKFHDTVIMGLIRSDGFSS